MYKIFSLLILSTLATGIAYAEEFTYEPSFDWEEWGCEEFYDGIYPLAQCYMEGIRTNSTDKDPIDIGNETECTENCEDTQLPIEESPIDIDKPAVINDDTQTVTIGVSEEDEKFFGEELERCMNDPPIKASDKEYCELLTYLGECQRGATEAFGVQQHDRFTISGVWINPAEMYLKSFELTGNHANLRKAVEECKWQHMILEPITLGPEYYNRYLAELEEPEQIYHGKIAKDVPVWSQERVNQEANFGWEQSNGICEYNYISEITRKYLGCPHDLPVSIPIPGVVTYQSDAEDRRLQYEKDDGDAQEVLIKQKILQDKLKQLEDLK